VGAFGSGGSPLSPNVGKNVDGGLEALFCIIEDEAQAQACVYRVDIVGDAEPRRSVAEYLRTKPHAKTNLRIDNEADAFAPRFFPPTFKKKYPHFRGIM